MIGSPSYLTASISTPSFQDLNAPVISFVGRPGDSRKGLQTFLDAINLLLALRATPRFVVWIVGGAIGELTNTHATIACRPMLAEQLTRGTIVIWGHVDTESLPDLYSRSYLVVMPSIREPFGLVALEAMACGTPVLASQTGGLADIVLDGYTGVLVETNDSGHFACAILAYLRDPERRRFHGANASARARAIFSYDNTYARFIDAYQSSATSSLSVFPNSTRNHQTDEDAIRRCLSAVVTDEVQGTIDCGTNQAGHASWKVMTASATYFATFCAIEPAREPSAFPIPESLRPPRQGIELTARYIFNAENEALPRLIGLSADAALIITEWHPTPMLATLEDERLAIHRIASYFREFRAPADQGAISHYESSLLTALHHSTLENIAAFDLAAAMLNRDLIGGALRFTPSHPVVELLRYRELLRCPAWPLPETVSIRVAAVIERTLSLQSDARVLPRLCHGSLSSRRLLSGASEVIACHVDECRYAAGALDEAYYVYVRFAHLLTGPRAAMKELRELVGQGEEFCLALAWLVAYLLFGALYRLACGKADGLALLLRFSDALLSEGELFSNHKAPKATAEGLAVTAEQIGRAF